MPGPGVPALSTPRRRCILFLLQLLDMDGLGALRPPTHTIISRQRSYGKSPTLRSAEHPPPTSVPCHQLLGAATVFACSRVRTFTVDEHAFRPISVEANNNAGDRARPCSSPSPSLQAHPTAPLRAPYHTHLPLSVWILYARVIGVAGTWSPLAEARGFAPFLCVSRAQLLGPLREVEFELSRRLCQPEDTKIRMGLRGLHIWTDGTNGGGKPSRPLTVCLCARGPGRNAGTAAPSIPLGHLYTRNLVPGQCTLTDSCLDLSSLSNPTTLERLTSCTLGKLGSGACPTGEWYSTEKNS